MNRNIILLLCFFQGLFATALAQTPALRTQLSQYLSTQKAEVGVAFWHIEKGDTFTLGNQRHYPMQSVFKFHLALAVLHQVDKGKFSLDQKIWVKKSDLKPNTWSPMRERYPEGEVALPLSEILSYTVSQSDNNGCDILFALLGSPKKVNRYMHQIGIKQVNIQSTEAEMHKNNQLQYENWTSPYAAALLLHKFYTTSMLSTASRDFMWKILLETSTGPRRIKGLLPEGTPVGHKTGTSGTNDVGITAATNDIGIICLPNGEHLAIAVLVKDSKEGGEASEKIIATVSKMIFDHFQP